MSATDLNVDLVHIPNPDSASPGDSPEVVSLSGAFHYQTKYHLVTLSSTSATPGTDIRGLLYTPVLPPGNEACLTAGDYTVPSNITRKGDLPDTDYFYIAIAPWGSPGCVLKFFDAVQNDPIRAFLFFLPNDDTSNTPPDEQSSVWGLGDDGSWKNDNQFPVYAIPGKGGRKIMRGSSQYSGGIGDGPIGNRLANMYEPGDYVRLSARIDTSGGTTLPSLWVFLLVVLGILLTVIGATSLTMHLLQRRRRQTLRRRVANGEVDLEALGIKRLTVPQDILDKMPLYTYGSGVAVQRTTRSVARETTAVRESDSGKDDETAESSQASQQAPRSALDQPTCAICLDDYVPAGSDDSESTQGTIVRELPCGHIFHPECVDIFLKDNSSLCPMCKKTALPKGYCPRVITNAMVRRERMVRRIRPRVSAADVDSHVDAAIAAEDRRGSLPYSVTPARGRGMPSGRTRNQIAPTTDPDVEREMSELPPSSRPPPTVDPDEEGQVQPSSNPRRREWARQRAVAMLGRHHAPLDPDAEEEARTPRWRKALRRVFPGGR